MYHQVNIQEPKDPMERIKQKALRVIAQHGILHWCNAGICGCIGCANSTMTREEYDLAKNMPEVVEMLGNNRPARLGRGQRGFYLTNDLNGGNRG